MTSVEERMKILKMIEEGKFLVIFASSKDRIPQLGEIHTNFKISKDGEYLALV